VPINRGTLQGDTLSPFLFLMYIEPLLRWLQVGGRGYQFGCLPAEQRLRHACSNLTYADDLAILTMLQRDLKQQAQKLTLFADWSHMKVNTTKTIVSGILHHNATSGFVGHLHTVDHQLIAGRLRNAIYVQGAPVKYLPPDEPFKYLGVKITLTLDWKPQFLTMLTTLKDKCQQLKRSRLPASTKLRIVRTVLKPKVAYAFSVAPYNPAHLKALDSQLAAVAKQAYGQRHAMPTAMVMEDIDRFGLGLTSLLVDYNHTSVKHLTEALNDATIYGTITHKLLRLQATQTAGLTAGQLRNIAWRFMRIRQLSAVQQSGLSMYQANKHSNNSSARRHQPYASGRQLAL
jgi:hypothetical protein